MKKLIYFLMAVLMVIGAVSCKKDDKPANGDTGNNDAPEIIVPEEAVDLGMVLPRLDDEGNPLKDEQGNEITYKLYWAKSNLCETGLCAKPGDYGDYYAWGETEPYYEDGYSQVNPCSNWRVREDHPITGYNWVSYKFRTSGDSNENVILSKYNTMDSVGPVDNITELQRGEKTGETEDDAAHAILKGKWRMPTEVELTALLALNWEWTRNNGIKGRLVTADNGNSIFLPAAGNKDGTYLEDAGIYGLYWSSSLLTDDPRRAKGVVFYSDDVYLGAGYRNYGFSIRPVWEE